MELNDDVISEKWEALHSQSQFRPRYPNEHVVRWAFSRFPDIARNRYRVLDLGSGAGRHTVFMSREGFEVTACDFSHAGLKETQARCRAENLSVHVEQCRADALPFSDRAFDGVLSFGVLYYLPPKQFRKAVSEIFRVLRLGGLAFIVTRTDADSRSVFSTVDSDGISCVTELPNTAPSSVEEGMVMTFINRLQVDELFSVFF